MNQDMIIIIDYDMGNIGSIMNMIKKAGGESMVTSDPEMIRQAKKIILPGVGAFDNGMKNLASLGIIDILNQKALEEKIPVLGVCLGMQLLTKSSEEGQLKGLGWVDAETIRFKFDGENQKLRIPHMGWNTVDIRRKGVLYQNMYEDPSFYFVHSFYVVCHKEEDISTLTNYGYDFVSSLQHENIMATQFHPEKSHKYGLQVVKNFVDM
jgi:imidazole glycerol-phosphate synthase subunit HisH